MEPKVFLVNGGGRGGAFVPGGTFPGAAFWGAKIWNSENWPFLANWCLHRRTGWFVYSAADHDIMHSLSAFLPSHSILSSPFRGHAFSPVNRFGGFLCIDTFSGFWQLQLINLGLSFIALSNYIQLNSAYTVHSPQWTVNSTLSCCPHHCLLVTIRISIADLIGGQGRRFIGGSGRSSHPNN